MIILDTSFVIDYLRGSEAVRDIIGEDEEFAITSITYHEILVGLKRKKSRKEEKVFRRFLSELRVLPFDEEAAEESSNIVARLMAIGREVNALDILIAGIAIANGAEKIVTRDADFGEIAKVSDVEVILY
ncbi:MULTISPECIES: type II toxin-antitoxin system VapC family toxin [unclassified Archaeoglobus]|jgi:hypothetical protein|uniref:type II toxin-antitoxin system VapC family toxin n=1 Tax=unclassified Archaeoglobus TaxID=2643606 RepID=UPI0025BC0FD2|nr:MULTISPECIES: PIN domain-containing protein [unclassified Archaeoglobus]